MSKKQTSIEWLIEQVRHTLPMQYSVLFEQAKAMHKEEIIKAARHDPFLGEMPLEVGENYYNDNYLLQNPKEL